MNERRKIKISKLETKTKFEDPEEIFHADDNLDDWNSDLISEVGEAIHAALPRIVNDLFDRVTELEHHHYPRGNSSDICSARYATDKLLVAMILDAILHRNQPIAVGDTVKAWLDAMRRVTSGVTDKVVFMEMDADAKPN